VLLSVLLVASILAVTYLRGLLVTPLWNSQWTNLSKSPCPQISSLLVLPNLWIFIIQRIYFPRQTDQLQPATLCRPLPKIEKSSILCTTDHESTIRRQKDPLIPVTFPQPFTNSTPSTKSARHPELLVTIRAPNLTRSVLLWASLWTLCAHSQGSLSEYSWSLSQPLLAVNVRAPFAMSNY
jgi:hypothetical protein